MESNTLPCPFCGYNDVHVEIETTGFGKHATASCQICGAEVHGVGVMVPDDGGPSDELVASAINAWNSRSAPKEPEYE